MSLLLESIKIERGQVKHLPYHEARMSRSRLELWGIRSPIKLREALQLPSGLPDLVKCRVVYGKRIHSIQFLPYRLNSINSLTLVEAPAINYRQKFVDRTHLKALYESRGQADDILIIKNGWVTDSYYCNVVFARGEQLLTPSYPLLEGTKRALLLEKGQIKSYPITASMIRQFDSIYLINAMIELGACQVPITNISGL